MSSLRHSKYPVFFFPPECIHMIVDSLDQTYLFPTLYALLTVNKRFFRVAAERLYARPCEAIVQARSPSESMTKFARLMLSLSPCKDLDVVDLRQCLGVVQDSQASIDYLALVQTMAVSDSYRPKNHRPWDIWSIAIHHTLCWAIAGHQLFQYREIQIPLGDVRRYHAHMSQLRNVCSIRFQLSPGAPHDEDHPTAFWSPMSMLPSHQSEFEAGAAFVRDLAHSQRPNHPLDIQFLIIHDAAISDGCARLLAPFFSRLAKAALQTISERQYERFFVALDSIDLSSIGEIRLARRTNNTRPLPWPTPGMSKILQQCRSLRRLEMAVSYRDTNAFDCVAQEAVQARSYIPLQHLSIDTREAGCVRLLFQAAWAFGLTLQSLHVLDNVDVVDISVISNSLQLTDLELSVKSIFFRKTSFAQNCKLRRLILKTRDPMGCGMSIVLNLPLLEHLELTGPIVMQVDHSSFQTMRGLQSLCLAHSYEPVSAKFIESWANQSWQFPNLRFASFRGPVADMFRLSKLIGCPVVEELEVHASSMYRPCLEKVLDICEANSVHLSLPRMTRLVLSRWQVDAHIVARLLPSFAPCLRTLHLLGCSYLSPQDLDSLQSSLPSLKLLISYNEI